jgi:hypothetical protein
MKRDRMPEKTAKPNSAATSHHKRGCTGEWVATV